MLTAQVRTVQVRSMSTEQVQVEQTLRGKAHQTSQTHFLLLDVCTCPMSYTVSGPGTYKMKDPQEQHPSKLCVREITRSCSVYTNNTWPFRISSPTQDKVAKLSVKCCLASPTLAAGAFCFFFGGIF